MLRKQKSGQSQDGQIRGNSGKQLPEREMQRSSGLHNCERSKRFILWVWSDSGYKLNMASSSKVGHCPTQKELATNQGELPLWDFGLDTALYPSPLQPTEQEIFTGLKSLSELPKQVKTATLALGLSA